MDLRKPSRTMVNTAMWRAVHNLLDENPKILADSFARDFAGFKSDEALLETNNAHPMSHLPGMRNWFVIMHRYVEDEVANAVAQGINQYVILGAGLDSFVFRRPDLMGALQVYEVDHPASQNWKRSRVAELNLTVPEGVHYVPIDFEHQTVSEALGSRLNRTTR